MPSSSFPVGKTVGAISCTTMTLFTKYYPPPLGTRINNTVPALKTTIVNRPVPALKKKCPSRREQKIQPPGPGAEKTQPPRPVPPRKKNTTASSRLGKKIQPPRPASEKNNNHPVPLREKKRPPRPASEKKKLPRPASRKKQPSRPAKNFAQKNTVPSRPAKNFHPYILPVPRSRRNGKGGSTVNFPPVPSRWDFSRPCKALNFYREKDSAIPFPRRPWSRILCTNDLIVLHPLGIFIFVF